MEFEGEFETHVTIRVDDPSRVDLLKEWAGDRGLTFHHIVLDRGQTTSQPMVSRRGHGLLSGELTAAARLRDQLAKAGFTVSRVKIEAAPWNRDVPCSDREAISHHPGRYFEHHVKLALGPGTDVPALVNLAQAHAAHLSRNAVKVRADGCQERFVTQRCYDRGRPAARDRLGSLLDSLKEGGYTILDVEEEYVVLDSDPGVDAGWLAPGPDA